ncbi:gram-negative porin family protein, partial [Vibrio parahaemolyticus V-223/04]
LVLVT